MIYRDDYEESEDTREPVDVEYHARVRETELAVLFKIEPGFTGKTVWVPKSLIGGEDEKTFQVPRWWAIQEGLD